MLGLAMAFVLALPIKTKFLAMPDLRGKGGILQKKLFFPLIL